MYENLINPYPADTKIQQKIPEINANYYYFINLKIIKIIESLNKSIRIIYSNMTYN